MTINSSTGAWDFYTSTDGSSWSALGTTQTPAPGDAFSVYDGMALVIIGVQNDGTSIPFVGKFYRAQILDGIGGTVVFDVNFANRAGSATFTEDSANYATVTLIEPAHRRSRHPDWVGNPCLVWRHGP